MAGASGIPNRWGWLGALAAVAVAVLLGLTVSAGELSVLGEVLVLVLFAVSTNIVVGYSGFVTFGQSLFYGLGAYVLALGWFNYRIPFGLLFVLAPLFGALAAFLVGLVALRTKRWFFALVTLAFAQLAYTIVEQAYGFTQGDTGVFGPMIPAFLAVPQVTYFFILGVVVVCLVILWQVTASPFGVVLRAARDNRRRMEALGVSAYWHQLVAFMISGASAAVAGALLVVNQQSAYPHVIQWLESGNPLIAAVLGGTGAFAGPIVGAIVFEFAKLFLTSNTNQWELILGVILVGLILAEPDGIVGLLGRLRRRLGTLPRGGRSRPGPSRLPSEADD